METKFTIRSLHSLVDQTVDGGSTFTAVALHHHSRLASEGRVNNPSIQTAGQMSRDCRFTGAGISENPEDLICLGIVLQPGANAVKR